MIVVVNRNKVELRKPCGKLISEITQGAQSAYLSPCNQFIVVTTLRGRVDIRSLTGKLLNIVTEGYHERGLVESAQFSGNDILIRRKTGRLELRKQNGKLINYL